MIQAIPSISLFCGGGAPPPTPPVGQWLVEISETPAGAKGLEAHLWAAGHTDARTYGLRDKQYWGDNFQVPIFEGKLKYRRLREARSSAPAFQSAARRDSGAVFQLGQLSGRGFAGRGKRGLAS
jgi:hypothetical protein